jgi:hypothetical protein
MIHMAKRGTNQQHTTSGGSADGSKLPHGEFPRAGARPPRRPRRGDQVTGLVTDPTSSPEMRLHNDAARAAAAAHNAGAIDSDGAGPVQDPENLLSGARSKATTTWADPSSLSG